MRILSECPVHKGFALLCYKRWFKHAVSGLMRSQSEMCGKCYLRIQKMVAVDNDLTKK